MRVEYDHYSKMCKSNKIPPRAEKDIPSYYDSIVQQIQKVCIIGYLSIFPSLSSAIFHVSDRGRHCAKARGAAGLERGLPGTAEGNGGGREGEAEAAYAGEKEQEKGIPHVSKHTFIYHHQQL